MQRRACPPAEKSRDRPLREGDRDAGVPRSHQLNRGLRGCAENHTGWNSTWLLLSVASGPIAAAASSPAPAPPAPDSSPPVEPFVRHLSPMPPPHHPDCNGPEDVAARMAHPTHGEVLGQAVVACCAEPSSASGRREGGVTASGSDRCERHCRQRASFAARRGFWRGAPGAPREKGRIRPSPDWPCAAARRMWKRWRNHTGIHSDARRDGAAWPTQRARPRPEIDGERCSEPRVLG